MILPKILTLHLKKFDELSRKPDCQTSFTCQLKIDWPNKHSDSILPILKLILIALLPAARLENLTPFVAERTPVVCLCFFKPQTVIWESWIRTSRVFNEGGTGASFLLQSVKCFLKGNEIERLNCDESLHSFRDQYFRLFELTQSAGQCCSITFDDFKSRSLIFVFDLTATLSNTSYPMLPLVKDGHLRLTCEFSAPSLIPITMITVAEIQSSVVIENTGRCTLRSI